MSRLQSLIVVLPIVLLLTSCAFASGTGMPQAEVLPRCVEPAGEVTLTVHTDPGAPVLYSTEYSDGNRGSPEPFGAGYGGNDGGFADANGVYISSWRLSEDAPSGGVAVMITLPDTGHHGHSEQALAPSPHGHEPVELEAGFDVAPPGGC